MGCQTVHFENHRPVAAPDAAVTDSGIFFSVLFNCKKDLWSKLSSAVIKIKFSNSHLLKLVDLSDKKVAIPTSHFGVCNVNHIL